MRVQHKLIRCEPTDPDRCQASLRNEQCPNLSMRGLVRDGHIEVEEHLVENAINCPRHKGDGQINKAKRESLHDYQLQVWQSHVNRFAESPRVKSLRGEIGVLRLVLEQILQLSQTHTDLLMYATKISSLVKQIEILVRSCDKLEDKFATILDERAALQFAQQIVEIVGAHIEDEEVLDQIATSIMDALLALSKQDDD